MICLEVGEDCKGNMWVMPTFLPEGILWCLFKLEQCLSRYSQSVVMEGLFKVMIHILLKYYHSVFLLVTKWILSYTIMFSYCLYFLLHFFCLFVLQGRMEKHLLKKVHILLPVLLGPETEQRWQNVSQHIFS